jgi:hypothetical protein
MKIIVSSRTFQGVIEMAIENNSTTFEIIGGNQKIIFFGEKEYSHNIMPTLVDNNTNYCGKFNPVKWFKLMSFIKDLELQPIVIEFIEYTNNSINEEPELILSQFIKRF